MRGRGGSSEGNAGDGSGIFVGEDRAGVGFPVELKAVVIDGEGLSFQGRPVVPMKLSCTGGREDVLEKAAGVHV